MARVIIIGIGNAWRGDDGAGLAATRALRERLPAWAEVREHDGEGTSLIDAWQGADVVVLVDAVVSGQPPGTIQRFEVGDQPLPAAIGATSTHGFGLGEAIELARVLDRLPPWLIIYGIEGQCFAHGAGLSPAVAVAVPIVSKQIIVEVRKCQHIVRKRDVNTIRRFDASQSAL